MTLKGIITTLICGLYTTVTATAEEPSDSALLNRATTATAEEPSDSAYLNHITAETATDRESTDSALLNRVFSYLNTYGRNVDGVESNVYIKQYFQTHKRNVTLWAVPSMYTIARGQRTFVSEEYLRRTYHSPDRYENKRQVYFTTIPRQQRTMPTVLEFATPSIYSPTLFGDNILSPFHKANRVFYRYSMSEIPYGLARLYFRPRYVNNTQLVHGQALVDAFTGRIMEVELEGEFDMLHFRSVTHQGERGGKSLLPQYSLTSVDFRFLGNHITSDFEAVFDCPVTLPDSVRVRGNRELIDSVRPIALNDNEMAVYNRYDSIRASKGNVPQTGDTIPVIRKRKRNYFQDIGWDMIGANLIHALRAEAGNASVRLSPIINPQYFSYSHNKGFSYRFKLGARYNISEVVNLNFNARFGYNFKIRQFYYRLPLRLNYTFRGHDAYAQFTFANGNRIGNYSVMDEIRNRYGDIPELESSDLNRFDDRSIVLTNMLPLNRRVGIEFGLVSHRRHAVNSEVMRQLNMPTVYRSLAPRVSLQTRPWPRGPLFTLDYERGLPAKGIDITYERLELDASLKHRMHRMQTLNLRFGGGLYTRRDHNLFMDFSNFRDENLPEGWNDDWSGNFQLLSSRLYNASKYYLRGNVSFESPLMAASFVPLMGRYIERERIYLSSLAIARHPIYSELGYGFTCRFFSLGAFASFDGIKYKDIGCKFTFELFRRW